MVACKERTVRDKGRRKGAVSPGNICKVCVSGRTLGWVSKVGLLGPREAQPVYSSSIKQSPVVLNFTGAVF